MFFKLNSISVKDSLDGFSLIEVMISLAIITIITTIVMIRYGSFNSAVLLKNQAFDMALTIREVQADAVSTRGDLTASANNFREGYGVYFDLSDSNQSYIIFLDKNDSGSTGRYDSGDLVLQTVNLDPRFKINSLLALRASAGSKVAENVSAVFKRPSYNAKTVAQWRPGSVLLNLSNVIGFEVELVSTDGPAITRTVIVNAAGLIEVR